MVNSKKRPPKSGFGGRTSSKIRGEEKWQRATQNIGKYKTEDFEESLQKKSTKNLSLALAKKENGRRKREDYSCLAALNVSTTERVVRSLLSMEKESGRSRLWGGS